MLRIRCSNVSALLLLFLSSSLHAEMLDWSKWLSAGFVAISAGPVWDIANESKTLWLQPQINNRYAMDIRTQTLVSGELFWGVQQEIKPTLQGEFGLAVAAVNTASLSGQVWQDANPEFDNYAYRWHVQDTRLSFKGKLLQESGYYGLLPYLELNLGVGFNRASNYNSTPLIFEVLPEPNFVANSTTTFTYGVGLGLQRALTQHLQWGMGYHFEDWGKNVLNPAPGQTLGSGLSLQHFYTNGLMFVLTYLA